MQCRRLCRDQPATCSCLICLGSTKSGHTSYRYLLEEAYPLSVPVMNAAATLTPWGLSQKMIMVLREGGCPWGARTTLVAAGHAHIDDRPIQWLLEHGCPVNQSAVSRLICHAKRVDLACKALRHGATHLKAHTEQVCLLMGPSRSSDSLQIPVPMPFAPL